MQRYRFLDIVISGLAVMADLLTIRHIDSDLWNDRCIGIDVLDH